MKHFIALIFAISLQAKAGNEGPQAAPPPEATVLAEYVANGGFFVQPDRPYAFHYQVLSDGTAQVESYSMGTQGPEVKFLKKLGKHALARFKVLVNSIQPGELYDPNPEMPECLDAPSFSYSVFQGEVEIKIGQIASCKPMKRHNATKADEKIMNFLKSLEKLNPDWN